ncbi:hypothetical protein [Streptomyces sp. NPDC057428]|uniref:hypothetical protein n=1 Tax=Streptomyces sp. NPDC057428 TaxID=3346129 RepID=UPI0036AF8562
MRKLRVPILLMMSPEDMQGVVEKQVREVHGASTARKKELVIDKSGFHGTDMIKRAGASGAALQGRVIALWSIPTAPHVEGRNHISPGATAVTAPHAPPGPVLRNGDMLKQH